MIKEELFTEIEQLPDHRLYELLEFARYLHYQEDQRKAQVTTNGDSEDPWANFIGASSVEPFADKIDEELYSL
jgi:hypothetical protein